jgi:PAS domain S-box-containing protein
MIKTQSTRAGLDEERSWSNPGTAVSIASGTDPASGSSPEALAVASLAPRAPIAWAPSDEAGDLWEHAVDSLPTAVAVLAADGIVLAVNERWTRGRRQGSADAVLSLGPGSNYFEAWERAAATQPFAIEALVALRAIVAGERDSFVGEYRSNSSPDERWYAIRAAPYRGSGRERVVVMHTDITARRRAERQARTQAGLLRTLDAAVVAVDAEGKITEWNQAAEELSGWSRAEMLGVQARDRVFPATSAEETERRWTTLQTTGHWRGDLVGLRRDGSSRSLHVGMTAIDGPRGEREGYVIVATDISDRLMAESKARDAADYIGAITNGITDGLVALDTAGRATYVNAAAVRLLGWPAEHLIGDVLHELTHYRHPDGTPHRFEDCPIVGACRNGAMAQVASDVFIRHDGTELPVSYTASPFRIGDQNAGAVLVFRDISEEQARHRRLRAVAKDLRWAQRVREALDGSAGRFELYAQPVVALGSGSVHYEELLLRMVRDGELVLPAKFLSAARRHGVITRIDRWVVGEAISLARGGRAVGLNLSAQAFADMTLLEEIERQLDSAALAPGSLIVEVAETAVAEDDGACQFLGRLSDLGCKIALDNFGSGSGGFTYLKKLPVDYLKIDGEFVGDLTTNEASHHVVEAVVRLARTFHCATIAERVEDEAAIDVLKELGVDYGQGYSLGRPAATRPTMTPSLTREIGAGR